MTAKREHHDLRRDFNAALCYFGNDPTRKAMLAAWWFIENVNSADEGAQELFFKVRELVRTAQQAPTEHKEHRALIYELVTALDRLADIVSAMEETGGDDLPIGEVDNALAQARALIAKARGEP